MNLHDQFCNLHDIGIATCIKKTLGGAREKQKKKKGINIFLQSTFSNDCNVISMKLM